MAPSLHGSKILITREAKQSKEFADKVIAMGGIPLEVPLLKISCKDRKANRLMLDRLHEYTWIIFTSSNGVENFFEIIEKYHVQIADHVLFAAVGHKTESMLNKYGYRSAFIPSTYNADIMAEEFLRTPGEKGPVLLIRGNRSRDVLPARFSEQGLAFDTMEVYETSFNLEMKHQLNDVLSKQQIDFITFTSPSTVESFMVMADEIPDSNYVCIGTTTEQSAAAHGLHTLITPEEFTTDAMLLAISDYINRKD